MIAVAPGSTFILFFLLAESEVHALFVKAVISITEQFTSNDYLACHTETHLQSVGLLEGAYN